MQRFVEFEIDIDPPSLVGRIISVRDQIAGEWTADLETLRTANEMILDSYYATQGAQRREEVKAKDVSATATTVTADDEAKTEEDEDPGACDDVASLTAPYSSATYEQKVEDKSLKKAYDRTAMVVLGHSIVQDGRSSSPYRQGSFDLLGLLATQESIHRVLRGYREAGDEREVSFEWLREFYVSRASKFFDGSQEYGRADDFLEELLLTAPAMKEMDGKVGFIDPMRIAEDIIAMRSEVAQDWRDIVVDVPTKDHADLRNYVLAIRMGKTIEKSMVLEKSAAARFDEGFQ